jgi:hypothetical protein
MGYRRAYGWGLTSSCGLLPVEGGEPRYRVRNSTDGHERALLESQIRRPEERLAKVGAPAGKTHGEGKGRAGRPLGVSGSMDMHRLCTHQVFAGCRP